MASNQRGQTRLAAGMVIIVFVVAILAVFVINPVGNFTGREETIKIGFIGPLTGELAAWGEKERKGIELAIEEANNAGGINNRRVEVVYEDSQCQPKSAALNVGKLASEGIQAIIGDTCSSATLAAAPIAESNKVVLITPISGADSISQAGDYIFRNFIPNRYYTIAAAERISAINDVKKVALMYINNDAGVSWKDAFVESFRGEITNIEAYQPDEKDFRTMLFKIKEKYPDLILLAGYYPDGALILKQSKELGLMQQFFGAGDAFDDPAFIEAAGEAAEGFVFQSVPTGLGRGFAEFRQAFESRYGEEPSLFTTYAYDTARVVIEAMKTCGLDSEKIKECLYKTDYQGVTNRITFNENGDLVSGKTIMKQVRNGEFIPYEG